MAKLTGSAIMSGVNDGSIIIDPFDVNNIGPNSYDLTLASQICVYRKQYECGVREPLDIKKENPTKTYKIDRHGFVLYPGRFYLGHTNEIAGSSCFVPCIEGRSSIARLGIIIHFTAGFGDLGFNGQWTLEISCLEPVRIYENMRICQVYFDTIYGKIDKLYKGKYINSSGAIASKSWEDYSTAAKLRRMKKDG